MSSKLIEKLRAERLPLHEKCEGCARADGQVCSVYYNPSEWWREREVAKISVIVNSKTLETEERPARKNICPMATHLETVESKKRQKINPLKASKRRAR
jgi:hypothetical protein